jgi:DNA-binding NarL/FixJ family response regulator
MGTVPKLIRILTVDDHPLLRKGIAALVNAEPDMKLIAEASNGQEAIETFRVHRPNFWRQYARFMPGRREYRRISQQS